jgi:hypothetical protein
LRDEPFASRSSTETLPPFSSTAGPSFRISDDGRSSVEVRGKVAGEFARSIRADRRALGVVAAQQFIHEAGGEISPCDALRHHIWVAALSGRFDLRLAPAERRLRAYDASLKLSRSTPAVNQGVRTRPACAPSCTHAGHKRLHKRLLLDVAFQRTQARTAVLVRLLARSTAVATAGLGLLARLSVRMMPLIRR